MIKRLPSTVFISVFQILFVLLTLVGAASHASAVTFITTPTNTDPTSFDPNAFPSTAAPTPAASAPAVAAKKPAASTPSAAAATNPQPAAPAAAASAPAATTASDPPCGLLDVGCWLTKGLVTVIAWLFYWIMVLMGYLLGLVGVIFNWIVVVTVFQYATYFGNSTGMLLAWGVLRDIGNIALVFAFIFMGILMILDIHGFDARKALPRLLIFAVLMNFSLFASEAIVDVANILSAAIYQQAGSSSFADTSKCQAQAGTVGNVCYGGVPTGNGAAQVGIADVIINDSYAGSALSLSKPDGDAGKQIFAYMGITIFILVVMAVLMAASIIFFVRAVVLTLLLIVSPLGFAGMAIPQFEKQANAWFQALLKNAFFAPTFLLIVLVGLKMMEALRVTLGPNQTLGQALQNPSTSLGSIFLVFGLTIGFMIAALQYGKTSSAVGASFATGFAQKQVIKLGMSPLNTGRFAGRVIGRNVIAPNADKITGAYRRRIGSLASKNTLLGGIAKQFDYMAGAGIEKSINKTRDIKVLGMESANERKKTIRSRDSSLKDTRLVEELKKELAKAVPDDKKIETTLSAISSDGKKELLTNKGMASSLKTIARNLSNKDYTKFMDDHEIDHRGHDDVKKARFDETNLAKVLGGMSGKEIAGLGDKLKKSEYLNALSATRLLSVKPEDLSDETARAIAAYVKGPHAGPRQVEMDKFKELTGFTNLNRAILASQSDNARSWKDELS